MAFVRHLIVLMVFMSMIVQPFTQTLTLFTGFSYELVKVDSEEDTDKEERQEDDNKDDIYKQMANPYVYLSDCSMTSNYAMYKIAYYDFDIEILIPPPDVV